MTNWREQIRAQIEQLWDAANYFDTEGRPDETIMGVAAGSLRVLLDVAVAAEDDRVCAEANCGKTGGDRDCSAYVSRGLRCSDCPVEVWLASTVEALDKLREVGDGD